MKRIQVNTMSKTMAIEAIVAGAGIWAYTVARRRTEADVMCLCLRGNLLADGHDKISVH